MEDAYTNIIYVYCRDLLLLKTTVHQIEDLFECYYTFDNGLFSYEIEAGSNESNTLEKLKTLTCNATDFSLYIQVICYNIAKEHVSYHIYKEGVWSDMLDNE